MALTNRVVANSYKFIAKYWYPLITRRFSPDDHVFLNWGYEEDPAMALPLAASDEPNRYAIQLYHRTATQADLTGKRVLEISCGHGGGASYLVRTLAPGSYTGLDLNPAGIDFCRKHHNFPGLNFMPGDAENLPFDDESFDAVINVEASHCYPSMPRFLSEVARVLRPGGHFLYTDFRRCDHFAEWDAALANAPMRLESENVISEQVARSMEKDLPRLQELFPSHAPAFLRGFVRRSLRSSYPKLCDGLRSGEMAYRMYSFAND